MARRLSNRIAALIATVALCCVVAATVPGSAQAWTTGNVWVNFGPWNCPSGGSVVGIHWAVDHLSSSGPGGDFGDNVIYPRVRVGAGAYNTLSYQVTCKKWGFVTYRGLVGQRTLTPYRSGLSYTL